MSQPLQYIPWLRDMGISETLPGTLLASVLFQELYANKSKKHFDDLWLMDICDMTSEEMWLAKWDLLKHGFFQIHEDKREESGETQWLDKKLDLKFIYHERYWVANKELIETTLLQMEAAQ